MERHKNVHAIGEKSGVHSPGTWPEWLEETWGYAESEPGYETQFDRSHRMAGDVPAAQLIFNDRHHHRGDRKPPNDACGLNSIA